MTPAISARANLHKQHVLNPHAGIPQNRQGSEWNYRLLIVERLDRDTVMDLTGLTQSSLLESVRRFSAEEYGTDLSASITGMRRAFQEYRQSLIFTALKEAA